MNKLLVLLLFATVAGMLTLSACETAEEETAEAPVVEEPLETPEGAPADVAGGAARLDVASQAPYGPYLTDAEGRALYLFTADTQGQSSACYDACAAAWPPLLTTGTPIPADPAVAAGLIGTIERRDGSMQVTYDGWPLYYYREDAGPGTVQGQDIHSFGGEWYLISPQGQRIEAEAAPQENSGS